MDFIKYATEKEICKVYELLTGGNRNHISFQLEILPKEVIIKESGNIFNLNSLMQCTYYQEYKDLIYSRPLNFHPDVFAIMKHWNKTYQNTLPTWERCSEWENNNGNLIVALANI